MLLHSINFNKDYYDYNDALKVLIIDMGLTPIHHRQTNNYYMFRINEVDKKLKHFTTVKYKDLFYKVYQY
jgi:hypothetical protein